jgi:hypothetical protein
MKRLALPESAQWHLIFPLGMREAVTRPDGTTGTIEFTAAWCARLAASFGEYIAFSGSHGMAPQPLGVYLDHSLIEALRGDDDAEVVRVGSVLAVHFHPQAEGMPAGVYALIDLPEWTSTGRPFLSPSTRERGWPLSTGEVIQGPALVEISVVAQPKLETIGSIAEGVHWTAFPLPEWIASPESEPVSVDARAASLHRIISAVGDGIITRSAKTMDPPEAMTMTPEQLKALLSETLQEAMGPLIQRLDALDARMKDYESRASAPADPPAEPAPAPAADPVLDLEARAKREFLESVAGEFHELVKSRRALPHVAGEFVARRLKGEDVAALLGDYSAIDATAGRATAPADKSPAGPAKVTPDDIEARARREFPHDIRSRNARFDALLSEARAAGTLQEVV